MGEAQEIRATVADALLSVLVAPACAACGRLLETPSRGPVCEPCWSAIEPITPPVCNVCGEPLPSWRVISQIDARCARCRRAPGSIDGARAIGLYDGSLRDIIHALKYRGRVTVAPRLGRLMRDRGRDLLHDADFAIPVPLHPRRRRARGFNQAGLLARHLGIPVVAALRRRRDTASQTELPAARRHRNVRDAFALRTHAVVLQRWPFVVRRACADRVRNRVVVLVDDVATTGATLEACARLVKEAGAREVRAVIAARAGRPATR
jgi:ComF family protein